MPEEPIHQPHDKLFKAGFSDPANAAGLLRREIPSPLSGLIDWDRLQLEPGTFVDSHYRHTESDLLFSAPFSGTRCLLYVLFEHQLKFEPMLALRLLRYNPGTAHPLHPQRRY
jgi:predicted transposase/invertase (TIGR01784 family)